MFRSSICKFPIKLTNSGIVTCCCALLLKYAKISLLFVNFFEWEEPSSLLELIEEDCPIILQQILPGPVALVVLLQSASLFKFNALVRLINRYMKSRMVPISYFYLFYSLSAAY